MTSLKTKIAQGVLQGFAGNVVVKVFAIIGYILILKRLSLHDYGIFVLLVSVIGPASSIILFSFDRIFVSHFAQALGRGDFSEMKALYNGYLKISFIVGVIFFLVLYVVRDYLTQFDVYLVRYFWLTSFFVVSQILMNLVSLFLEGSQHFKEISVMQSVESITRAVLVVVAFFSLPFSIGLVLVLYTVAKVFCTCIGGIYVFRLYRDYFQNGTVISKKGVLLTVLRKYGVWDIARNLFEQILQPAKLFVIKFFINIEGVAVYDFARNVYAFAGSLFPVKSVIFPAISRSVNKPEILFLIIEKSKKYLLILYVGIYMAVFVVSPFVINNFFSQYSGLEYVVYIMMIHLFVDIYKIGQEALFYAFNKQSFLFKVLPLFTVIAIVLDVLFARGFGIIGIVVSWHIYALITGFVQDQYLSRVVGVKRVAWRDLFRFDEYDRAILFGIGRRLGLVTSVKK